METNYRITIHDIHEYEVETADATVTLFGDLAFPTPDTYVITYEDREGDLAGCTTQVTCKNGTSVSITRTGPFDTELVMEKGRRHTCQYNTEFGSMLMGVYATRVDSDMTPSGGTLDFSYDIDFSGDFVSRNHLQIECKEIQ